MKRKLVHKDLIKVKKLLAQLDINGNWVTFDLAERTVEGETPPPPLQDGSELQPEGAALSEEEVLAELARQNELPPQTALRYHQNCAAYFETEEGRIILSSYNIKLLRTLDQMYARGLTTPQVIRELQEGDFLVNLTGEEKEDRKAAAFSFKTSSASLSPAGFARRYSEAAKPFEFDGEEAGLAPPPERRARKVFRWALLAFVPLLLLGLSYQLGYLGGGGGAENAAPQHALRPVQGDEGEDLEAGLAEGEEKEGTELAESLEPSLMPEEVTVDVLNGCGVRRVAGRFAGKLREEGYQVREVADAASFDYRRSQIISRLEGNEAQELLEMLPQAKLQHEPPGEDKPMITIIIGQDHAS